MDMSGVGLYWLDRAGAEPPPALGILNVKPVLFASNAPREAAVAFFSAALRDVESTCLEIRARLGAHAVLVLVATADRDAAELIARGVDDVCAPEALSEPELILARAAALAAERFRAAETLLALERRCARTQAGLDTLPTPFFIKDSDALYIGCNKAFEAFIGRRADEILGKTVYDVAPSELAKHYEAADRRLLADGGVQIYEASVPCADGSHREVMFHKAAYRDGDGAVAGMAGVMLDISERKRVETALQDSERRYRDVFDNASDCIALIDATAEDHFKFSAVNPAMAWACGLPAALLVGKSVAGVLSPNVGPRVAEYVRQCLVSGSTIRDEASFESPSGVRVFLCSFIPVAAADGSVHRVIAIGRDMTDERAVDRLRRDREQEFRSLVDNSPDAIVRYDRACRRIYSNRNLERRQHVSSEKILGKTPVESVVIGDVDQARMHQEWLLAVMEKGVPDERELIYVRPTGERRIATVRAVPERGPDGEVVSVLTISADTHDRVNAERQLRQREQEFRTLVENSPDLIARYDAECRRLYVNPAMRTYMGEGAVALGETPIAGSTVNAEEYTAKLREVLTLGRESGMECAYRAYDGAIKWSHVRIVPEFDQDDKVTSVLAIGRDITEIVESRRKIQRLAFYDSLTGLPNRSLLSERIAQVAARARGADGFALMLLDLDRFKEVNDTFGHAVGDELLCKVAARLRRCVRRTDTMSRLGGDEFALLLPNVARQRDFGAVAAKLLRALDKPFHLAGREIMIFASIGIAESDSARVDIDTLFKQADSAMYHAKRMGRNNYQFFTPEMMARNVWRMAVETNLRKAISRGELDLYFQPRVSLPARTVLGAEALLRWRHGELGFLTPDKFINVAEDSGQIVDIGRWVLCEACQRAAEWNKDGGDVVKVSVNLSSRQFVMNDLVGSLQEILSGSGCEPGWLELEITESLLLEDNKAVRSMLQTISKMGVAIAVDDFGTGFSALSYLTRFPITTLKIDRSFISDVDHDRKRAELVKAIIGISTALELKLVAEGVENDAQADFLLHAGCKEAQGYLFGKPMPALEFGDYLRSGDRAPTVGGLARRGAIRA
jgi:diguanylate cyclase (GGDEF)-like protein/PAS domain S-box-containing protein